MKIPSVSRAEMVEIDRAMIEDFGIDLTMMMENAGKTLAVQATRMLDGSAVEKRIAILVGRGNNGGGGLVAGRHLRNWGAIVHIVLGSPEELKDEPRRQLEIAKRLGLDIEHDTDLRGFDLLIDSLIGYNLKGDPREPIAALIKRANRSTRPILSLDLPSGLDSSSGLAYNPCIAATATLTLALPKAGLMTVGAKRFVGELYLADISIPREIYEKFGVEDGVLFKDDFIIPLQ
ncbi:MAG: NAD(P)H-hydrate epimerase [Candidatus Binatia bacterium]